MRDITEAKFPKTGHRGLSLVECLVFIVVFNVTMGAVFNAMAFTVGSYASGKAQKEARALLFTWVEGFESVWPTPALKDRLAEEANDGGTYTGFDAALWASEVERCFELVCGNLWGTDAWDAPLKRAQINGLTVDVRLTDAPNEEEGAFTLEIDIGTDKKRLVNLERRYNIYNNNTVRTAHRQREA